MLGSVGGYGVCVSDLQHSDWMKVIMTVDQARGMSDQLGCWICSTHSLMCDLCSCNESSEIAAGLKFSGLGCTIYLWMRFWGPGDERMNSPLTSPAFDF